MAVPRWLQKRLSWFLRTYDVRLKRLAGGLLAISLIEGIASVAFIDRLPWLAVPVLIALAALSLRALAPLLWLNASIAERLRNDSDPTMTVTPVMVLALSFVVVAAVGCVFLAFLAVVLVAFVIVVAAMALVYVIGVLIAALFQAYLAWWPITLPLTLWWAFRRRR